MRGVNKHFGDLHVLKDIDLTVAKGEVVIVIGPSGSGKSTLCRAINRLETIEQRHDRDRRRSRSRPRARTSPGCGPRSAWCSSSSTCSRTRPCWRTSTLGPIKVRKQKQADADRSAAASSLDQVGVGNQADKYPAQLSGGQQQRVAIARALAMNPEGHAVRRADVGPRPGDDQRGARRDDRARQGRHDDGRGHARDGIRPPSRRPSRVHGRRRDRRGGNTPNEFFSDPQSDRAKDFLSKILTH